MSRNGYWRQIQSPPGSTSFMAAFDDLQADTQYTGFVSAVDGFGHIANRQGTFITQQRNVHAVYGAADLRDAPYGNGGFAGQTWFEGQGGFPYAVGTTADGDLWLGAQAHHADDTDRYLSLGYELTQMDPDAVACEVLPEPETPEDGPANCDVAATAWLAGGSFDLDARPSGANPNDYWLDGVMTLPGGNALPGGYGAALDFSVPVADRVTFTP